MGSFSYKSFIKIISVSVIAIGFLLGLVFVQFNNLLSRRKTEIIAAINQKVRQDVRVEKLSYRFPDWIVAQGVDFLTPDSRRIFSADKIKTRFSVTGLVFKQKFTFTALCLEGLQADYLEAESYVQSNIINVAALINNLNKAKSFYLKIKKSSLYLSGQDKTDIKLNFDTYVKVEKDKFKAKGSFYVSEGFVNSGSSLEISSFLEPFEYKVQGSFRGQGLRLEAVEISRNGLYGKFWGSLKPYLFKLYGFCYLRQKDKGGLAKGNLIQGIIRKGKLFFSRRKEPDIIGTEYMAFYMSDLDCLVRFRPNLVEIENIDLSLNGVPVNISGSIKRGQKASVDLQVSSFKGGSQEINKTGSKGFKFGLKGEIGQGAFTGRTTLDFIKKESPRAVEKIKIDFDNLSFKPLGSNKAKVLAEGMDFSYQTSGYSAKVILQDFICSLDKKDNVVYLDFDAGVYDGFIKGRGNVDITEFPAEVYLDCIITDARANEFKGVSEYFSKIYGVLAAHISYRNFPATELKGKIDITQGLIDNMVFFKWVSDFLAVPSLRRVSFQNLLIDFLLNHEGYYLKDIVLKSKGVGLTGYFNLYSDELVRSKISLSLSKDVLSDSSKFRSMLSSMGGVPYIDFDFRLSGLFSAMNFKWLDSEFKQGIRNRIPDFMERGIEKKIEKVIESMSISSD